MSKNDLEEGGQPVLSSGRETPVIPSSMRTTTEPLLSSDQFTQHLKAADQPPQSWRSSPVSSHEEATQADPTNRPVIAVQNLSKVYHLGRTLEVVALCSVSLRVSPGEFVVVMGPSGSGKSTLLHVLGCLDRPTAGSYWLDGQLISQLSSDELAAIRNRSIGFVFQSFNLLGRATALKNVALPLVYAGYPQHERERRAMKVLQLVGLGTHAPHKPSELSGGQQQRVAIARALVNGPAVLLADEPTGNLDRRTGLELVALLQTLNEQGLTIVLVTHDPIIASYAKRRVVFLDGHIVEDEPIISPRSAYADWLGWEQEQTVVSG